MARGRRLVSVLALLLAAGLLAACGLPGLMPRDGEDLGGDRPPADAGDSGDDADARPDAADDPAGDPDVATADAVIADAVDLAPPPDVVTGPEPPADLCAPVDLTAAPAVQLMQGPFEPMGVGGEVGAGTWVLTSAVYNTAFPALFSGRVQAVLEVYPKTATQGLARVRLAGNVSGGNLDQMGAGVYNLQADRFQLPNTCPTQSPFDTVEYTATDQQITAWLTMQVFGVSVQVTAILERP